MLDYWCIFGLKWEGGKTRRHHTSYIPKPKCSPIDKTPKPLIRKSFWQKEIQSQLYEWTALSNWFGLGCIKAWDESVKQYPPVYVVSFSAYVHNPYLSTYSGQPQGNQHGEVELMVATSLSRLNKERNQHKEMGVPFSWQPTQLCFTL